MPDWKIGDDAVFIGHPDDEDFVLETEELKIGRTYKVTDVQTGGTCNIHGPVTGICVEGDSYSIPLHLANHFYYGRCATCFRKPINFRELLKIKKEDLCPA